MKNHTHGPWVSKQRNEYWATVTQENSEIDCGFIDLWSHVIDCDLDANVKLVTAAPELYKLAERIANLNKDAGEIGAGMLNSLVDESRRIIDWKE